MSKVLDPFRFVLIALAGWMNHRQYQVIDYLREENRVLREQLGNRRLRFNDDQRRIVTGLKMMMGREQQIEPENSVAIRLLRKIAPVTSTCRLRGW